MTKLVELIDKISTNKVYIQTHNFPDPDAIASAYGLQVLLENRGIASTICYKGDIKRTVASKMAKLLGIDMTEYSDMTDISQDDEIILVDSQKGNPNIVDMEGKEIICIDHHPIYGNENYMFSDIRPQMGACASIIASYYFENNIKIPDKVVTALLYGIKVDTADMKRGVEQLDLDMFYKLYPVADQKILSMLDSSVLNFEDLRAYDKAITSVDIEEDMCFANAGADCKESLIATIADFLMALDGVDFAVVYSIKSEGVKLSIRSNGKYPAGTIANAALKGIGSGGGHENMSGGFIPFKGDKLNIKYDSGEVADEMQKEIKKRFIKEIKKNKK